MNTMKYAFAMLGLAAAPAVSHAATLVGSFYDGGTGLTETFDIDTTPFFSMGSLSAFTLTDDSFGADTLLTAEGLLFGPGTEYVETLAGSTVISKDFFAPPPYDPATGLVPGVYSDSALGSVLTLGAVPEPTSWALLITGAALAGGALRQDRRRRQSAAMA